MYSFTPFFFSFSDITDYVGSLIITPRNCCFFSSESFCLHYQLLSAMWGGYIKISRSIGGWNHFADSDFLTFVHGPLLHEWWPNCHWTDSYKKSKKNIPTLKLFTSKGFFGLQNARNRLKILWEHYKASFTSKTRCKGDIVEGEVVVNLHGDQLTLCDYITMLWRNRDI